MQCAVNALKGCGRPKEAIIGAMYTDGNCSASSIILRALEESVKTEAFAGSLLLNRTALELVQIGTNTGFGTHSTDCTAFALLISRGNLNAG